MSFYKDIHSSGLDNRQLETFLAIFIMILAVPALIVVLSTPMVSSTSPVTSVYTDQTNSGSAVYDPFISDTAGQVVTTGYTPVAALSPTLELTVLVGLQFRQPTVLNQYLSDVQNPSSPAYHHYMTKQQFYNAFSPSQATYTKLVNFFSQNGFTVSTFPDRVSIKLFGTVSQFENVFHTQIQTIRMNSRTFYAPVKSMRLNTDASSISAVIGLNNYFKAQPTSTISQSVQLADSHVANPAFTNNPSFCNSYLNLTDNNQGGLCENQLLVGSDMQSAYQVNQLINAKGYAYNETVATILWSGNSTSGAAVAPFNPADLIQYFTNTLPSNQPQPNVSPLCANYNQAINQSYICGYPVDGAYPHPDITSKNDSSQANFESTLDLEMVGSIAPGANAVEVYGPAGYSNYLDDCFATILNAQSGPLSHTVAISNSWGTPDDPSSFGAIVDPLWIQYTQEAAGLGITVLAASGDNANLQGQTAGAPSSVGFNNYGVISVGGTQTVLNGNPSTDASGTIGILNQTVWVGTPAPQDGSQGGVSVSYTEPVWQQQSSDANYIIKALEPQVTGRGTPDIAGVAANMNITISYFYTNASGYQFNHSFRMLPIWGTSVASPLVAGVIANMDHYLGSSEGYFEGLIYQLGQSQIDGLYSTIQPFYDVGYGSFNYLWLSYPGYDLATGWGSINAYNFVQDQPSVHTVTFTETGLESGASWSVYFDGAVLSSMSSSITFMAEPGTHSFSISTNAGQYSSVGSGTVSMGTTSNQNVQITFSNPASNGKGVGGYEAGYISNAVTFSLSSNSKSDLPIAELFSVPQEDIINSISLYLNGTGKVSFSIGTNLWQSDILAPITINVNGQGWYNVSFPTVFLYGNIGYYYLNVLEGSQKNNFVSWGVNPNAKQNSASLDYNDVGSFNSLNMLYPYNYYLGYDPVHPALYVLGFTSNPPTIQGSTGTIYTAYGGTTKLSWTIGMGADVYGPNTYTIYKNGVNVASGNWIPGGNVTFTSPEYNAGTFNYTIHVTDLLGGYASLTAMVHVASPTTTNSSTSTTSSTHASPGFEVVTTILAIMVGVTFYLRKRSKK